MFLRPLTQSIQEAAGQTELDGGWTILVGLGATFLGGVGHFFLSADLPGLPAGEGGEQSTVDGFQ